MPVTTSPVGTGQPINPIKTGDSQLDQFGAQVVKAVSDLETASVPVIVAPKDASVSLSAAAASLVQWVFPYNLKAPRTVSVLAPGAGRVVLVKADATCTSTNTITVRDGRTPSQATLIDSAVAVTLSAANAYVVLAGDGRAWHIIGRG